jgi:RHS repeat-associated protein
MSSNRLNVLQMVSLLGIGLIVQPMLSPLQVARAQQRRPARLIWRQLPGIPKGTQLQVQQDLPGQSSTVLADGSILTLGGTVATDTTTRALLNNQPLSPGLGKARGFHSSTQLPDGRVLVFGGLDRTGLVTQPEVYDAVARAFHEDDVQLQTRAFHSATVLTDGRVLIVGGVAANGRVSATIQVWDPRTDSAESIVTPLSQSRRNHTATLQADGTVLIEGGLQENGSPATLRETFDPESMTVSAATGPIADTATPGVSGSLPVDGANNVDPASIVAIRFARRMNVSRLNRATVSMRNKEGPVAVRVTGAEGGRVVFVAAEDGLKAGQTYTIMVVGAVDLAGNTMAPASVSFSTGVRLASDNSGPGSGGGTAAEDPILPALQGRPGRTALSGQVHNVAGKALKNVTLELECEAPDGIVQKKGKTNFKTKTDSTGRFLLEDTPSGHCELEIDGSTAQNDGNEYGLFFPSVDIRPGITNVLPYTIWLTPLDMAHEVTIPSPTTSEVIVKNPNLPGLELRLPPNATITDYDGKAVKKLTITKVPLGRPPFPLPKGVAVPFYFTIQPGGAYISVTGNGPKGAQLYYPNTAHAPAGTSFNFWDYDPEDKGWYVYGKGKVSADRRQVVPDASTRIYEFTGAMVAEPGLGGSGPSGFSIFSLWDQFIGGMLNLLRTIGDPVDPSTGKFLYSKLDMAVSDVMPAQLTRTYQTGDFLSRSFGVGSTHPYDMFLVGDTFPYTYTDLIGPFGSRIHFNRISPGSSFEDAVYQNNDHQSNLYKATIVWNGTSWTLTLKNGIAMDFEEGFGATAPGQSGLIAIRDRNGNRLSLSRAPNGNLLQILTPNGRALNFVYDTSDRISGVTDNIGRQVLYTYDTGGRLETTTDPLGGVTRYTYDANNQMLTVRDPRNILYLTNQYDNAGRVSLQTMADTGTYQFAYTEDGNGNIIQTDVTDPRGTVQRLSFNTSGYFSGGLLTGRTEALGQAEQQIFSYQYSANNFLSSVTDPLDRQVTFAYDTAGNMTGITQLAGTPDAITATMGYGAFNLVTSVTDPLNHTTTLGYDTHGNVTSITNPLNNTATLSYNGAGQVFSITPPLIAASQIDYSLGLPTAFTDPLGNAAMKTYDNAGRPVLMKDALGNQSSVEYDAGNRVTKTTNALGGITQFSYDANSNLLSVTDANSHGTGFGYDNMDRQTSRTDPLNVSEGSIFDKNGNVTSHTDRKGQVTQITYDKLNRPKLVTLADTSTITLTYDAGNRLTQMVDSANGTISRTYDNLDRVFSETSPTGSVSYTYDNAGRRSTMVVSGQSTVNYTYDVGNRLMQIQKGSDTVSFTYDAANRRTTMTLPNGVVGTYGYDGASRLTSMAWANGATSLGALTYGYDAAGRRTEMGGSLARVVLPGAMTGAGYNAANQLTSWKGATLTYDANGNLTNDGARSFTWNARDQLTGLGTSSFAYDAAGRRQAKTIGATTTSYFYDGANSVQEQVGGSVVANRLTGFGMDEMYQRTDTAGAMSYLTDGLSSAVALLDGTGVAVTEYSYEPFGATSTTGTASANSFEYTGRENDGTGLMYYRARYYSPEFQRFVSQDPLGFGGGDVNLYGYVGNSPMNGNDPTGLFAPLAIAGVSCLVGAAGAGLAALATRKATGQSPGNYWAGIGLGCVAGALMTFALSPWLAEGAFLFWSGLGQGGADIAVEVAQQLGRLTLEMTYAGQVLSFFGSLAPSWLWSFASAMFALRATSAIALLGSVLRPGNTWQTIEEPILNFMGTFPFILGW